MENFKQTIIMIREENRKTLKALAAMKGMPMYLMLDEILSKERENLENKLNK